MPNLQIDVEVLNDICGITCPYFEIEAFKLQGDGEIVNRYFKCANMNLCNRLKNYLTKGD